MTARDLMSEMEGLEQNALDKLREAEQTGGGVKLPFPAAYMYWHNGQSNQKNAAKDCPPLWYGGWATDTAKITELVEAKAVPISLSKWSPFEGAGDRGSTFHNLASRTLTFATVGSRTRWISGDGKTSGPDFDRNAGLTRQHMQLLALAYIDSKPWGYVVLTTKGFQVQRLRDAIEAWGKAIAPFRKELNATQIPLSAFAITVGSVGAEPKFETVGATATNKITPIQAAIPENLDAKMVGGRFIGPNNLRINAERLEQAREWLGAWKKGAEAAGGHAQPGREEETEIPF